MSTPSDSRTALPPRWILIRDVLLFGVGLVFAYLEVRRPEIRDSVLIFVGGMLGLPAALHSGSALLEAISSRGSSPSPPSGTPGSSPSPPEPPPPPSAP